MKPIPTISTLLTVAFVVLKVIGQLHWSWWWIWSPLWIWITLLLVIEVLVRFVNGLIWKHGSALDRLKLLQQGYEPPHHEQNH